MFATVPGACRSSSPRAQGVWNGRPLGRKPSPGPGRIQSGSDVWQNRLESSSAPPLGGLPCVELAKLEAGFEKPWRKPQPGSLTSHSTPSVHHPGTPRVDLEPGGCTGELRARPATGQPRQRQCPQHRPISQMLPGHLPTAQKLLNARFLPFREVAPTEILPSSAIRPTTFCFRGKMARRGFTPISG